METKNDINLHFAIAINEKLREVENGAAAVTFHNGETAQMYEPITVGGDHITFLTGRSQDSRTLLVPFQAIASVLI